MFFLPYLSAAALVKIEETANPKKKHIPKDEMNVLDLQYKLYLDIQLSKVKGSS
jgi:hypothetical protein